MILILILKTNAFLKTACKFLTYKKIAFYVRTPLFTMSTVCSISINNVSTLICTLCLCNCLNVKTINSQLGLNMIFFMYLQYGRVKHEWAVPVEQFYLQTDWTEQDWIEITMKSAINLHVLKNGLFHHSQENVFRK